MIAQVWTITGQPGGQSDEEREWTQRVLDEAVSRDGVEANVVLGDPTTGQELAITFFRDQAALDAFEEFSSQKAAESEERSGGGLELTAHVYTDVMAAESGT
mgnify:CR=1 FL=1